VVRVGREAAVAFVEGYGAAWERWDVEGFVDLFAEEVVYVAHAIEETVVGSAALASYVRKEAAEQGQVSVHMGSPVVEADRVVAEFWVTATKDNEQATIVGCFIARLAPDGRCSHFREYWFDGAGHTTAYAGWGE
jgi:ketosteroid isomerase-like protein